MDSTATKPGIVCNAGLLPCDWICERHGASRPVLRTLRSTFAVKADSPVRTVPMTKAPGARAATAQICTIRSILRTLRHQKQKRFVGLLSPGVLFDEPLENAIAVHRLDAMR